MDYRASEHLIPIFDFGLGLHLELNTALFIFVLVLIVMFSMNRLLFEPVLRTLDNRSQMLGKLRESTQQRLREIEALDRDFQTQLARVREEVNIYRQEARRDAQDAVEAVLADARRAVAADLTSAMSELEKEAHRLRDELTERVGGLARQITHRVLEV